MFDFHKNHQLLVSIAFIVFLFLSFFIAIVPAYEMQKTQPLPNMEALSPQQIEGLKVYTAENCMACHTQQVRNIEMDNVWGDRPSLASDYYYSKARLSLWQQSPSLLGSERTGPDLTNIGKRRPSKEWHLIHLYNPRIVVPESIMPAYPWLFEEKDAEDVQKDDIVVALPRVSNNDNERKIVATKTALNLITYILSLKQVSVSSISSNEFIPSTTSKEVDKNDVLRSKGKELYIQTCAPCHQENGEGIKGAFPSLVSSQIVNSLSPDLLIKIILQGYDARSEYGIMPSFEDQLTDEDIAAISNHERTSWGNDAPLITKEKVKEIRNEVLKSL